MDLSRRLGAEFIGTGFLLATVVGSGIMAERLADGNVALALMGNTIPTGAILVVLITMFGPISGHALVAKANHQSIDEIALTVGLGYVIAQIAGGLAGTWAAHLMFAEPVFQTSLKMRTGLPQWFAESVATFGLLLTILITVRVRPAMVAAAVGLYITAAYWFTASTSFANPAVTIARSFSDTFAGIRPSDAPEFVAAQFIGGFAALGIANWLFRPSTATQNKSPVAASLSEVPEAGPDPLQNPS